MNTKHIPFMALLIVSLTGPLRATDVLSDTNPKDKAPSMDKVRWTEAKNSFDVTTEYDYVGGPINEQYTDTRVMLTRRTLLAFLINGAVEFQSYGYDHIDNPFIPGHLYAANLYLALDFRWSPKSLIRIQSRPGLYSDLGSVDMNDFNTPTDIAYTHIASKRFQWAFGVSLNTWRKDHILPGGGFRYQLNDRWKLKFMMPTPQIEYKARDDLHLFVGCDLRGDTFRVSKNFGTLRGDHNFDNAVVDYEEIRAGPGFSWNIKPLLELNAQAGYLAKRQFDFHNNTNATLNTGGGAFVMVQLHALFRVSGPEGQPSQDDVRGHFENDGFSYLFKFL